MTFVAAPNGQYLHTPRAVVYTNTHTNTYTHSYTSKTTKRILIDKPQQKVTKQQKTENQYYKFLQ